MGRARANSHAEPTFSAGSSARISELLPISHMGMGQNITTRGPQVLVFGSIYQGKPFSHFGVTAFLTTTATCCFFGFCLACFHGALQRAAKWEMPMLGWENRQEVPRGRPPEASHPKGSSRINQRDCVFGTRSACARCDSKPIAPWAATRKT